MADRRLIGTTFDWSGSITKYTLASFMMMSEALMSMRSAICSATYWLLKE